MARPSGDSEQKLIMAGCRLAAERGFSAFRVRDIAAEAGVNPGMFHYHFKTKQEFTRRVMRVIYGEFLNEFRLIADGTGTPPERLKNALLKLALFAHKNRYLLKAVLADLLTEPEKASRYLRENFVHHVPVFVGLIKECRDKGYLKDCCPLQHTVAMMIGIVIPGVMFGVIEQSGTKTFLDMPVRQFGDMLFSEGGIRMRIDLLFEGIMRQGDK